MTTSPSNWLYEQRAWTASQLHPLQLPRRFAEATLATIEEPTIAETASRYCQQFWDVAPNGIAPVFLGKARTWKTYAACAVLRVVQSRGQLQGHFLQCAVDFPQADLKRYAPETEARIREWHRVPFLVVDDFACIPSNSWAATQLVALAEARFAACLPTLYTANVLIGRDDVKQVSANYGTVFARRLYDASAGFRVVIS